MRETVFIVIPAFNEATTIREVINEVPQFINHGKYKYDLRVIAVDDGSNDSTVTQMLLAKNRPKVISHVINSGAGGATRTGIAAAVTLGGENLAGVVTMDADGQHAIDDVLKIANLVIDNKSESKLFIGDRLSDKQGMTGLKRLGNILLTAATRIVSFVSVRDSQSGLRGFTPGAARRVYWVRNDYAFCSEMIIRAKAVDTKIVDVPIKAVYSEYSKSKGQSNWNGIKILVGLVSSRLRVWSDT